tara:strand:- start:465 stop:632 length:168 start_codon:yes stop_codon:yes gene_type:complete
LNFGTKKGQLMLLLSVIIMLDVNTSVLSQFPRGRGGYLAFPEQAEAASRVFDDEM